MVAVLASTGCGGSAFVVVPDASRAGRTPDDHVTSEVVVKCDPATPCKGVQRVCLEVAWAHWVLHNTGKRERVGEPFDDNHVCVTEVFDYVGVLV
jgi:hypothetical protein